MERMRMKRELALKWDDDIWPKIHKILEKKKLESNSYVPSLAAQRMFEVRGIFWDQFLVDLDAQTCSCRRWDPIGIPCAHAVAVIWNCYEGLEAFVDHWYRKDTYLRACNHIIYPMNGQDIWVKIGLPQIRLPKYSRKPGRPKKVRIREPDEQPK
ncbi:hypothetical protein ACSBR2_029522 [Camellia fascicularis]